MLDGRRHSVDIPLSKALVALRRVRSLRDPSTNSVTKFSGFVDNLTWETDSYNGISLGLGKGSREDGLDNHSPPGSPNCGLNGKIEEFLSDPELEYSSRKRGCKLPSKKLGRVRRRGSKVVKAKQGEVPRYSRSNRDRVHANELFSEGNDNDYRSKTLQLACIPPSNDHLEDEPLSGEATFPSARLEKNEPSMIDQISAYSRHIKSSRVVEEVSGSCVGSPYPSISNGRMDGSSHSTSLFTNEEVDIVDDHHRGCGISCWSRTPRFREPSLPSDVEDHPLLSRKNKEVSLSEQEWNHTYVKRETTPCSDSPRSISRKFRPRSFDDLVGQNVVAHSLLSAISKGKITPLYLFHGPRGTGKTSASRIFAAALNCLSLEEHRPCGLCRECRLFFSGKGRNIKEVDPARVSRADKMRSLLKSAARPPVSSRYKAFIIDECQLLHGETWSMVLNSMDDLPRHVVFIMITADLDSLPRSAVSRCQRYHFPKIKDSDIVNRLAKICVEEGFEFEKLALDFIAAKSNGSLRDAEMILDQLSLLGKRITITLAHELIGIVSDEELFDLLKLALSSDTSNTVRRARELMRSRVDPMQLISQLANLIMDILAGKCQTETSEVGRIFLGGGHTSEADLEKLRNALKILSETEKQLRTSKNQTTWLTVALLQLSSVDSSSVDASESRACCMKQRGQGDGLCSASSIGISESFKHSFPCACCDSKPETVNMQRDNKGNLDTIWRVALQRCQSNALRRFLQKEGKLSSVCVKQGMAVAEVEFCSPGHVSRAEKSWKLIANSLQLVLGCNVEIRINLVPRASSRKHFKVKKTSFNLLSCSRRRSATEDETNMSDNSEFTSSRTTVKETPTGTCSSDHGTQFSPFCSHRIEAATTIRNSEGNALGTSTATPRRSVQGYSMGESQLRVQSSKLEDVNRDSQLLSNQEPEPQPSCFSKTLRFQRRSRSDDVSHTQSHHKEMSSPQKPSFEPLFCATDPYILYTGQKTFNETSIEENGSGDENVVRSAHCWRAPKLPLKKAWQLRPQHEKCQLMGWLLPCTTAK